MLICENGVSHSHRYLDDTVKGHNLNKLSNQVRCWQHTQSQNKGHIKEKRPKEPSQIHKLINF